MRIDSRSLRAELTSARAVGREHIVRAFSIYPAIAFATSNRQVINSAGRANLVDELVFGTSVMIVFPGIECVKRYTVHNVIHKLYPVQFNYDA